MNAKPKTCAAVSVIGLLVALGIFALILCGLLYVGGKLLDSGRTISERREAMLTNEMKFSATDDPDPVIERLAAMPELVLVDSERTEMTDAQFFAWAASLQNFAILYAETLGDPWTDTGNRLYGSSNTVKALLRDWCSWEAVYASVGATKDGRPRTSGFYVYVPEGLVQQPNPEK